MRGSWQIPIIYGSLASAFLLGLYWVLMSLGSTWNEAFNQLLNLDIWVIILVIGFGVQVGLFSYLKSCQRAGQVETGTAAASTTTSTLAMIACCLHHLTDILPILGLTVATTFLVKYQSWLIGVGIVSNLVGIGFILRQIQKKW